METKFLPTRYMDELFRLPLQNTANKEECSRESETNPYKFFMFFVRRVRSELREDLSRYDYSHNIRRQWYL